MSVWAVIVARVGGGAKSRLAMALAAEQRHQLALAMLADVLRVCTSFEALDGTVAVLDTGEARELARGYGAQAIPDDGHDMNAAALVGLTAAGGCGASTVIVLPGDIPLLSVPDLEALLAAATNSPRALVVGASHDGQGTNALLLRPWNLIAPAFGPPSVERHVRLGLASGAEARVLHNLGLALDVDTPAELAMLADLRVGPNTADFLAPAIAQLR